MKLIRVLGGAVCGVVATATMSAHMLGMPSQARIGAPPPSRLAGVVLPRRSPSEQRVAATLLHLAIGTGAGAAFGAMSRRGGPLKGAAFGLAVWAWGYEIMLPLVGVMRPAHRDSPGRVSALIQAHLIYGATLGALMR